MTCASRYLLAIVLLSAALALPAAQPTLKRTEQQLRAIKENLERVQRQVAQDAVEKDRMNRDLRQAERSVSSARGSLRELRNQRTDRAARRQKLVEQRAATESQRKRSLADLAQQLRSAYFLGGNEPLKLLLNQRNTSEISRNLTYYGYFGRARAGQIDKLNQDVAKIEELTASIDAEDAELARLEQQQKERVGELDDARKQRGVVLASLEKESRSRVTALARLKKNQQDLEGLLKRLSKATEPAPYDPNSPFARQKGGLSWPVAGRVTVDYGGQVAGGLRSDGIEIEAERGSDVRAVQEGEVIYADWLSGRGLLIILDHGNGYWSLYGHNEQLFRQRGDQVKVGETIAAIGDSGGRKTPGLYFEIRRDRKPVDPRGWFRSPKPPAG